MSVRLTDLSLGGTHVSLVPAYAEGSRPGSLVRRADQPRRVRRSAGEVMIATMSQAHAEWHQNAGVPMGTPGCPQDACHLPDDGYDQYDEFVFQGGPGEESEDEPEVLVKCGLCKEHQTVEHVRAHYAQKYNQEAK